MMPNKNFWLLIVGFVLLGGGLYAGAVFMYLTGDFLAALMFAPMSGLVIITFFTVFYVYYEKFDSAKGEVRT